MANIKISPDAARVLRAGTTKARTFILPPGQLDRALYVEVDKILKHHGARWMRNVGHVFGSQDELDRLMAETMATGVSVDVKKVRQAFFTPPEIARQMALTASVNGRKVLEPSAGRGALALACLDDDAASVNCYEIDVKDAEHLRSLGFACTTADFLLVPKPVESRDKFDRVVMNPPFTKKQDLKHVGHALNFVREGGRLVAIVQGNRSRQDIFDFVPSNLRTQVCDSIRIEPLDDEAFKESGTKIKTALAIIDL